ncbi:MAG: DUF2178 domain-containing protein [Candidatus Micrarchaeia archaeon]
MVGNLKKIIIVLAAAVVATAIANVALVLALPNLDKSVATVAGAVVAAMAAVFTLRYLQRKEDGVLQDERTKKVHNAAMAYSWWLTYVLIAILLWVNYLKLAKVELESALSLMFFFMVATYTLAKWWLSSRGDA